MRTTTPHTGMNLDEALDFAKEHGCEVQQVRRHGELRVKHPSWTRSVLLNQRRKGASLALTTALKKLSRR